MLGSLRVIGSDMDRSAAYDFLLMFHSNHGPISYGFRDKRRFPSKPANFPHPAACVYFAPSLKEFLWELGIRARGQKKQNHGATRPRKKSDNIFSHLDTIHQRDRQTAPGDDKDRAYA